MGVSYEHLKQTCDKLFEFNPMLGHRGSRLGITYPEIYRAQARAILEAAVELRKEGVKAMPEIMLAAYRRPARIRLPGRANP